jgi:glycosyltransferase involved in cell wall biosynthesis
MKKVCVVGHFGFGENMLDGQTIKTKIVTTELENQLGTELIKKIDTHGGLKALPQIILQIVNAFKKSSNIIILPAHNGIKVFVPICVVLNKIYKRKIHYVVIGGWLPKLLNGKPMLIRQLKKFNGIYVETNTMKRSLEAMKFDNLFVLPNFKDIIVLDKDELVYTDKEPYKLCTFSRVMKEKGIEDAIEAVRELNDTLGRIAVTLDIYGQVDCEQIGWFEGLRENFPQYIQYCGNVPFDESVDILKSYFALLFPTHFYTEGIPGTILDAYASGIPVICSKWESFDDLVEEGITGLGYSFNNKAELVNILYNLVKNPFMINSLKVNCLKKAHEYSPNSAVSVLMKNL